MKNTNPSGVPIADYSRPIYEDWDARGLNPPKGYESWMALHAAEYGTDIKTAKANESD